MTTATDHAAIDLTGTRMVVTGGTKGIGAAIARHATAAGAEVLVAARAPSQEASAGRFVQADVSTPAGVATLVEAVHDLLGGVDVIVDNAGNPTHAPGPVLEMTDEDWMGDLNVNLMSAVRLDRALLPSMIARGSGVVIHMSSVVSRFPPADVVPYAAAKGALNTYSKALSNEVARHGIRVNNVLPGIVETAGMTDYLGVRADEAGTDVATARQVLIDGFRIPMGAMGDAVDVARLVVFLASPHASYLTGGQFAVDGGMAPAA